jgi:MFS family permease
MSVTIFLPLFLVNVLDVSATGAGAALIPFSLGLVLAATVSGQIVTRVGYRRQIFVGGLVFLAAVVLLSRMGPDVSYGRVTLYMVIAGLGVGPAMPLFTLAVQNAVEVRFVGQATSASQFFRQTGATVGAALMGTVLATTLGGAFAAMQLPDALRERSETSVEQLVSTGGADLPAAVASAYASLAAGAATQGQAEALRAEGLAAAERIRNEIRDAFTLATRRIYGFTALILAIATALALRIPELPLRTTHDRAMVLTPPALEGP